MDSKIIKLDNTVPTPTLADARLKCFSDYTPVKDVEVVDAKQKIFKGTRIVEPGTPDNIMMTIYFRRANKADVGTEIETMWPELHIHDHMILGYEFWLIPRVKMLFGYDPPSSSILKAPMSVGKTGPFER